MMRLIASTVVALIANAVALIVGDVVFGNNFSMPAESFIVALALFTATDVVIQPLIRQTAVTKAPALIGSTALVATLVALIVTTLATDMSISGFGTWILATVVVWAVSVVAKLLLPLVIFKKALARDTPAAPAA